MFNFGGSKSKTDSNTNQEASSSSELNQNVYDPNGAYSNFYNNANNLWNYSSPNFNMGMGMQNTIQPFMNNAATYGRNQGEYMGRGGAYGQGSMANVRDGVGDSITSGMQSSPYLDKYLQNGSRSSKMYNDIIGGEGNSYIDPLVNRMNRSGQEQLQGMQNRNAVGAAAMGQSGSSRHAMTNAMAERGIHNDMLDRETQMRAGAYDTDLNWKMGIANMADSNALSAATQADSNLMNNRDAGMSYMNSNDANRQFGMNYQPMNQNLGMGMMAPWQQQTAMPWNLMSMYSNTMGNPTVLSNANSNSNSSMMNNSRGSSGSFGFGIG